jgi:hypothetical protein
VRGGGITDGRHEDPWWHDNIVGYGPSRLRRQLAEFPSEVAYARRLDGGIIGRTIVHTAIVLGGGLALLLSCLLLGHAFGGGMPGAITGAKVFLPLWLVAAGVNMWLGVSQAGYSIGEEFPIFLAIFGAPAALAGVTWWLLS